MNQNSIRNFAIIAHVDHGKSTLADRLLELTGTVAKDKMKDQLLDQNPISRERGITIKLAPVRMYHTLDNTSYMLNLIDTPGHVDFSYEVSRTLAACEGAILLVDATQGIQAQTVAHFQAARKENLSILPVINKIDLQSAQSETVIEELIDTFSFKREDIILLSAKTGENVPLLLDAICGKLPPPKGGVTKSLRALIFDAVFDEYRGVVAYVRIMDGVVKKGDVIKLFQSNVISPVSELGFFSPFLKSKDELSTGEIGYIITGIKNIRQCRVGDTLYHSNDTIVPLPGYKAPKPMVFLGMYPKNQKDLFLLKESLGKLMLNDTALSYFDERSAYLGSGYRVGFLGLLHADIVKQRLKQEFNMDLLYTMPQVLYQKRADGTLFEPYMKLFVYTPTQYVGSVMTVCQKRKGKLSDMRYFELYAVLTYEMPYGMFVRGLSGELKSVSSGFASLDYEPIGYRKADLIRLEIKINDKPIDVLSELVYRDEAQNVAIKKAQKLKELLPRQQFRQIIQAVLNGIIVTREEIPPFRKDVLQKLYGGDRTRKDKLLEAQRKGKGKLHGVGKIDLPQEALFAMISER